MAVTGRRARTVLLADAAESVVSCGRVRATLSMGKTALLASSLAFHSMLCAECRLAGHDFSLQKDGLEPSRPRGPLSKRVRLKYNTESPRAILTPLLASRDFLIELGQRARGFD